MHEIVVDTNIIFSALLNKRSNIAQLILNSNHLFNFHTPNFTITELNTHKNKIINITRYSENEFNKLMVLFLEKLTFFDENEIPDKHYKTALNLCNEIDEDDLFFVALANHLNAKLWTGDKKLMKGLKEKGYNQLIDTKDLFEIYITQN